jgi:ubiquinone/menaquinone biosynthesis C-methylase UbiE
MDPEYALNYINEFVRILKPRGLCVFQLPDKIEFRANYENFSENIEPVMEMYGISKDDLTKFIKQKGGKIIDIVEDQSCGPEIKSFRYFITKSTNIR